MSTIGKRVWSRISNDANVFGNEKKKRREKLKFIADRFVMDRERENTNTSFQSGYINKGENSH